MSHSDHEHPNKDELVQMLITWLSLPTYREACRFLEAHLELLTSRSYHILAQLTIHTEEKEIVSEELVRDMYDHLELLRDAHTRSGTMEAIREIYIDRYGGFVLDLPAWLAAIQQQLADLSQKERSDSIAAEQESLLRGAIVRAQGEGNIAPETLAELRIELGNTLAQNSHLGRTQTSETILETYQEALLVFTLPRYPRRYAWIWYSLGNIYCRFITIDPRTSAEQAIACYEEALQVYTREDFSTYWATIHHNMGNAYRERLAGERPANLERAIVCYEAALQVYTSDAFPEQWAMTQHNLGMVYRKRFAGDRRENLEHAIAHYEATLQVYTRKSFPINWAMIQNSLGTVYCERIAGERKANQEQAIAHYQDALQAYTREDYPEQWATVQHNLGNAYRDRICESRKANLERAIACYRVALQVRTREFFPNQWAMIQQSLGTAFSKRIAGERKANQEQAIAHYQNALQVYTREDFPVEWASIQHNLGIVYAERIAGERKVNLEQAITHYQDALQIRTREGFPGEWAMTQNNLGNVYQARIGGKRRVNLERAITCYEAALQVYTPKAFPEQWAVIQYNLGNIYSERIEEEHRTNQEKALVYYKAALQVYTRKAFPEQWAMIQNSLGDTYQERIAEEHRGNLERAIAHYKAALRIRTRKAFPEQWAITQHSLGNAYRERITGEHRDNLERAIAHHKATLQVYTREAFPIDWAAVQHSLGNAHRERIVGERRANLERAITCYEAALQVYTPKAFPIEWAAIQHSLGVTYSERIAGDHYDNLEHAITCYQLALQVRTREAFPIDWAMTQHSLGNAYRERVAGERRANLEQAIAYHEAVLQVYTREAFPIEWAMTQNNLGIAYCERIDGERRVNLKRAVACYQAALQVRTREASPSSYRFTQLNRAFAEAERENWETAHAAYAEAQATEDVLIRLGAGVVGYDAILREGHEAAMRDGFILTRLGQVEAAVIAMERGRARGLAETLAIDTAASERITDKERRTRYEDARECFRQAQAVLYDQSLRSLSEDEQRGITLERNDAYHKARETFDAITVEIQEAQDPSDFLDDALDAATILHVAEREGAGHALVYLATTPWGGVAIAALSANPDLHTPTRFAMQDLPSVTEALVDSLLQTLLDDQAERVIGGYIHAQEGNGWSWFRRQWKSGKTIRQSIDALHMACTAEGKASTLCAAAQEMLHSSKLGRLIDQPHDQLDRIDEAALANTLGHFFLCLELGHCLDVLAKVAMRSLVEWLQQQGATSLTLIPCGALAAFPLANVPLFDGRTVSDVLPTSIALSVRSLLHRGETTGNRQGVYAVGDPHPTHQKLEWGEAEAHMLAKLARNLGLAGAARVHEKGVRSWLAEILQTGWVVDVSCHGKFDPDNFLWASLQLARGKRLTLAEILNHEVKLQGLRLLILSACQTAVLDLRGARNEVRSLAAAMIQAGARAVLASLWSVDDKPTCLLIVRFAQEWFPEMRHEPPAAALARAQRWLRTVTYRELLQWQATSLPILTEEERQKAGSAKPESDPWTKEKFVPIDTVELVAVRGSGDRYDIGEAMSRVQTEAKEQDNPDACPYVDPIYWAGFQIIGW